MIGRTLLDSGSPITQSIEAVVGLLKCLGRSPEPLPEVVDLGTVKLVRSNKGDVFYCVTATSCSCPSATYRSGRCKHQRKYFPGPGKTPREIAESDAKIKPLNKAKWAGGFNGPVDPDTIRAKTESPRTSILANLIDAYAPTTTENEVQYWQKKQGQEA